MPSTCLLIQPPTGLYIREDRCQAPVASLMVPTPRAPVDLALLAAIAEQAGCQAAIRDYPVEGGGWCALHKDLATLMPNLLLINTTFATLPGDHEAALIAKGRLPGVVVVAKGPAVHRPQLDFFVRYPAFDVLLQEEYFEPWARLCKGETAGPGMVKRSDLKEILKGPVGRPDLDALPLPARHLLRNELYRRPDTNRPLTTVYTSLGCDAKCTFCLAPSVWGSKVRTRPVKKVLEELQECVERFGIRDFYFLADTFTADRGFVLELCEGILEQRLPIRWVCNSRVDTLCNERARAMKAAGCDGVALGIESANIETLRKLGKQTTPDQAREAVALLKGHGLQVHGYFLIGLPWEDAAAIRETVNFALELETDFADFNLPDPFPGTPLERQYAHLGLLGEALPVEDGDYARPRARTLHLSREELVVLRREAMRKFYLRPGKLVSLGRLAFTKGFPLALGKFTLNKARNLFGSKSKPAVRIPLPK